MRCLRCALPIIKDADTASIRDTALPLLGLQEARICGHCLTKPPAFDATLALADYAEPLATLARALKFNARLALASTFAQRLALLLQENNSIFGQPDLIIPVPLSQRRLITRGYNQAWEIARPLAHLLAVPAYPSLLARIIDTSAQAKLAADARQRNVRKAFALSSSFSSTRSGKQRSGSLCKTSKARHTSTDSTQVINVKKGGITPPRGACKKSLAAPLQGYHVAVVDDVMTSGATLNAIARTLKSAGAARVTNLVVLRTTQS